MIYRLLLLLLLTRPGCTAEHFRYEVTLDPEQRFHLRWEVDYKHEVVYFRLDVKVDSHSWFAMGFSEYGELVDADLLAVWTDPNGMRFFQDAHTDRGGVIHIDSSQDYRLVDAWSRDGMDAVVFYRKFDTCRGDYVFDRGTTHILYMLGEGTPATVAHINTSSLTSGLQRVQLLKPEVPIPQLPPDAWTFEIVAPSVEIPSTATTYWWYVTLLPHLPDKHHIIKYEPVIDQREFVHHMEVFHCVVSGRDSVPFFSGSGLREGKPPGLVSGRESVPFFSGPGLREGKPPGRESVPFFSGSGLREGKPPELKPCRRVIGAWAMGAGPISYPEEAGVSIGGADFSRFVLLEIHYNNPSLKAGYLDSSGIRFTVTRHLRHHDAGIMELGLEYTNKMAIPPGEEAFKLKGYCVEECTAVGLPPRGIWIFASQLHTHLTGRRVYTKHVRHGRELPEVNRDNHYSPHFQEIRLLPEHVHILPGDAMINTCEDRTVDRKRATIGGFAITDEMCVNYVHYYPKVDLEVCKSSIQTSVLHKYFSFMKQ